MHQAVMPRGPMGVAMGWFLERGNAEQNRVTVDAIDLPPGGSVLEVGFGPGHALQMLAAKARLALLAGVDHSKLMVETARRRLMARRGLAALDLRVGKAADLPFADESFDVAFAVNAFHQWPNQEDALAEMAGVLKPGGELVLSIRDFRERGRFEPAGAGEAAARQAASLLAGLGLSVSTKEIIHSTKRATFLVRGCKPA